MKKTLLKKALSIALALLLGFSGMGAIASDGLIERQPLILIPRWIVLMMVEIMFW